LMTFKWVPNAAKAAFEFTPTWPSLMTGISDLVQQRRNFIASW
jgi:hypothetical protein